MEKEKLCLPEDFLKSVKNILGDEFENFIKSYEKENYVGLRYNPLKSDANTFLSKVPLSLTPVPWAEEGFYYLKDERPGKSPLHEAGAYYIQEPSAMSAVSVLNPLPGDFVLDLCAAPGGKSTQIAGRLNGKGLLVSNEYVKDRSQILSSNIERMGVQNAVVLNETPENLSGFFPSFFDKILVDAPCSGEGMFKKEESALKEWSLENVKMCHERQLYILDEAALMLKAGGVLTYSTCTFNETENEGTVNVFLESHPEFSLVKTERFWPHKVNGEGHFVALFQKEGILSKEKLPAFLSKDKQDTTLLIKTFLSEELALPEETVENLLRDKTPVTFGENIYLISKYMKPLKGLKVVRPGLHVAVSKKNRLEPAHSLAVSLKPSDVTKTVDLSIEDCKKYIAGETINCDEDLKGWVLVSVEGFSIGFGKASGGVIKNHYPKGLRKFL